MQRSLGSDIVMCFDECPPSDAPREYIEEAVARTIRWAALCAAISLCSTIKVFLALFKEEFFLTFVSIALSG